MSWDIWIFSTILGLPFSLLIGWMAKSYQRSSGAWFLLAVTFTPLVTFVFLLVAGVPHSAVVRKDKEERDRTDDVNGLVHCPASQTYHPGSLPRHCTAECIRSATKRATVASAAASRVVRDTRLPPAENGSPGSFPASAWPRPAAPSRQQAKAGEALSRLVPCWTNSRAIRPGSVPGRPP